MTSRPPAREDGVVRETYEIRVEGDVTPEVRDTLAAQIDGLHVAEEPVASVLSGPVEDQAALHGLLDRLLALGLVVVEVRRVPGPSDDVGVADVPGARVSTEDVPGDAQPAREGADQDGATGEGA